MANVFPNRDVGTTGVAGVGTTPPSPGPHPPIWQALNAATATWVGLGQNGDIPGAVLVGLGPPPSVPDDLKWARGEVRYTNRSLSGAGGLYQLSAELTVDTNPAIWLRNLANGDPVNWTDSPTPDGPGSSRFVAGPRMAFAGSTWTLARQAGWGAAPAVNAFRFELWDVTDPPTVAIVGPVGAVPITPTPDGGDGVVVQWTPTVAAGVYAWWSVRVSTSNDPTAPGVFWQASAADTRTQVVIPGWALAPFLATQVYVHVQVGQDPTAGTGFLPVDPARYRWQTSTVATAGFTATGTVTTWFGAVRPAAWVDDLDSAGRVLIGASHQPVAAAVLYQWDGARAWPLDVVSGAVTMDATRQIRATCTLELAAGELMPDAAYPVDPDRALHPFGSYVQVARGIGDTLVSLGAFVIDTCERDDTIAGAGLVAVTGSDWARFVADARFTYNKVRQTYAAGAWTPDLVTDAMAAVVLEMGLRPIVNGASTARVAPNYLTKRTDQRPSVLDDLATSIGWWWWADPHGAIVLEPRPDPSAAPRYQFVEGPECIVERHGTVLSRVDFYDTAVAYDDAGLWVGGAYDANPRSPIARGGGDPDTPKVGVGPFAPGGKAMFFASPLITSEASAQASAATVFGRAAVPAERVVLDMVPAPDLRPGHVFTLARATRPVSRWICQSVVTPLEPTERQTVVGYFPAGWKQVVTA